MTISLPDRLRATGLEPCAEYAGHHRYVTKGTTWTMAEHSDACITALLDDREANGKTLGEVHQRALKAEARNLELVKALARMDVRAAQAEAERHEFAVMYEEARATHFNEGLRAGRENAEATIATMRQNAVEREAEVERLKVQRGYLIRCEGCEKTVDPVEEEGWGRTSDDCDLCPKCYAEFVAETGGAS